METPPCKGCPDRHAYCHSDGQCPHGYTEYAERQKAIRKAREKRLQEGSDIAHVRCDKISKFHQRSRHGLPKKY